MKRILWCLLLLVSLVVSGCGAGGTVNDPATVVTNEGTTTTAGTTTTGGGTDVGAAATDSVVKGVSLSFGSGGTTMNLAADGTKKALLRVAVTNTAGGPISGALVNFDSAEYGTFDPAPATATTDATGVAQIYYVPPTTLGTATITATAGAVFSAPITATLVEGAPASVVLKAAPTAINPGGIVNCEVMVYDAANHPIPGIGVDVVATPNASGGSYMPTSVTTDAASKKAIFSYTVGSNTGSDRLFARAGNLTSLPVDIDVDDSVVIVGDVKLLVDYPTLDANGLATTMITAVVTDNKGNPALNMSVNFTLSDPVYGTLSEIVQSTDEDGMASTIFRAKTKAGKVTIAATCNGFYKAQEVILKAGEPANITLALGSLSVEIDKATIATAVVMDANNNPIPGATVLFTTSDTSTAGFFEPSSLIWYNQRSVTTNANGRCQTTVNARGKGNALIAAEVSGLPPVSQNLEVLPDLNKLSITLGLSLSTAIADGVTQTNVVAVVDDVYKNRAEGINVLFSTSAGTLSATSGTTNANGEVIVTLTSPGMIGNGIVTVSSGVMSDSAPIEFVAGPPANVAISASPSTIGPGAQTMLLASVTDTSGNPAEGVSVRFEFAAAGDVSKGQFANIVQTTDANGRASTTYTAGAAAGTDKIQAVTAAKTSSPVNVTVSNSTTARIAIFSISAQTETLIAAPLGVNKTSLIATVKDENGAGMANQTVTFTASQGTLSAASAITGADGTATVSLASTKFPAVAYITAETSGFVRDTLVSFVPGPPAASTSSIVADPATIPADGKSTSAITVTLLDANSNPVKDGTAVALSASAGTLASTTATTTSGRATFTITSATSQQTVNLSTNLLSGLTGTMVMGSGTSGEPANIKLAVSDTHIFVAGVGKTENTNISVNVLDADGLPINDSALASNNLKITWKSHPRGGEYVTGIDKDGTIAKIDNTLATMFVKTFGGAVALNMQSGVLPGTIEIELEALKADGSSYVPPVKARLPQIIISSGPPHTIVLTSPITDAIVNMGGGVYKRKGTAIVTDRFGNSVPDGTAIHLGLIDSVIAQGVDGVTTNGSAVLTSAAPKSADGTPTTFSTASIVRNAIARYIQANDRVLINNSGASDKSHYVGSAIGAGTLDTTSPYLETRNSLDYAVGASLLGGYVDGCQAWASGPVTNTHGSCSDYDTGLGVSKEGFVPFWVVYPANYYSIMTGAVPSMDTRVSPLGSAQVILVASSSDDSTTMLDRGFYFAPIAGFTLTAAPAKLTTSGVVDLGLVDGGDKISVPFFPVGASITIDKLGTNAICSDPTYTVQADCEANSAIWLTLTSDFKVRAFVNTVSTSTYDLDGDGYNDMLFPLTGDVNGNGIPDDLNNDGIIDVDETGLVSQDFDRDGTIDFYTYPYTFVGGGASANVVVTGAIILKDDAATVTFVSGDGSASVKVVIP